MTWALDKHPIFTNQILGKIACKKSQYASFDFWPKQSFNKINVGCMLSKVEHWKVGQCSRYDPALSGTKKKSHGCWITVWFNSNLIWFPVDSVVRALQKDPRFDKKKCGTNVGQRSKLFKRELGTKEWACKGGDRQAQVKHHKAKRAPESNRQETQGKADSDVTNSWWRNEFKIRLNLTLEDTPGTTFKCP